MEWFVVAGLVGVSGYFVIRHISAILRGEKGGTCCGDCASCHIVPNAKEKKN